MKWFKHYSNATHNLGLSTIIDKFGFEGYGRYWRFLEFLCENFDGESTDFKISKRVIRDILRIRSGYKLDNYLVAIGLLSGIKIIKEDSSYKVSAPILLELKSRDFKKARHDRATTVPKNKNKNKNKSKKEPTPAAAPSSLVTDVVNYLNEKTRKTFKPNSKSTIKKINARAQEDYSLEDFKAVIDFKCKEWNHDPKWSQYLQPDTLFSTKFEGYLQASKKNEAPDDLLKIFEDHGGLSNE